jgi:hypothetical protein
VRRLESSCTDESLRIAPDPAPLEQGPRRPCYSPACREATAAPAPPQSTEDHRRPCFCGIALEGPEVPRSLPRCLPPSRLRGVIPATVRDSVVVLLG